MLQSALASGLERETKLGLALITRIAEAPDEQAAHIGTYAPVTGHATPCRMPDMGGVRSVSDSPHTIPDARVGSGSRPKDGSV